MICFTKSLDKYDKKEYDIGKCEKYSQTGVQYHDSHCYKT